MIPTVVTQGSEVALPMQLADLCLGELASSRIFFSPSCRAVPLAGAKREWVDTLEEVLLVRFYAFR